MDDHAENALCETYTIRSADKELHCMDVLMEALRRHLLPDGARTSSDEDMAPARRAVRWLASRIGA